MKLKNKISWILETCFLLAFCTSMIWWLMLSIFCFVCVVFQLDINIFPIWIWYLLFLAITYMLLMVTWIVSSL